MDENEITQRLRDAGDQPVPGEVRAGHLSQMQAAAPVLERPKRFGRLAVAAAAFVGFAVGSTGFAMAGALPDPAQNVAHDLLAIVNVNVEKPANRGQCVSDAARNNPDPGAKEAAKALCPKGRPDGVGRPDHAGEGKGRPDHAGQPGGPNGPPHPNDDCTGPPPWAGKDGETSTAEAKAAYRQGCVDDEGEIEELDEQDIEEQEVEPVEPEQAPADEQPPAPQGEAPEPPADPPVDAPAGPDAGETPPVETPAPPAEEPVEGEGEG